MVRTTVQGTKPYRYTGHDTAHGARGLNGTVSYANFSPRPSAAFLASWCVPRPPLRYMPRRPRHTHAKARRAIQRNTTTSTGLSVCPPSPGAQGAAARSSRGRVKDDAAPTRHRHEEAQEEAQRAVGHRPRRPFRHARHFRAARSALSTTQTLQTAAASILAWPQVAAKAAAYDSQKAAQVARRARTIAHRSCADYKAYTGRYWRKIKGIQRDFEAAAKDPPHTQHKWLQRVLQAELLWNQKYSGTLLHVVVAYGASVEAKNAKIAALEARLARGGSPQSAVRMRRRI